MERAAVLIGVKTTGGMPALQAVDSSVAHMAAWLREQGLPEEQLRVISDAGGQPVTVGAIKEAVKALLDLGYIEQLIVYFSGHGAVVGASEFWLLSGAPSNADEAVNVDLSVSFARRSTVPHVILVSDACRTPAAGMQGQSITGSAIFPNVAPRPSESSVDVFFGCALGTPSLEVQAGADVGGQFRAVFTDSLVHALRGNVPDILEAGVSSPAKVVRAWPLKKHLKGDVVKRIRDMKLSMQTTQSPDARITSEPSLWVSFLKDGYPVEEGVDSALAPAPAPPPSMPAPAPAPAGAAPDHVDPPVSPLPGPFDLAQVADTMLIDMLSQKHAAFPELVAFRAPRPVDARSKPFKDAVRRLRQVGQVSRSFDNGWIQVEGIEANEMVASTLPPGSPREPATGWLSLANGGYLEVPNVPGFITMVSGEDGRVEEVELTSTAADHSSGPSRIDTALSALISGAVLKGGFNPDPDLLAQICADSKGGAALSFGATLHLAYALHDWNMQPQLAELSAISSSIYGFYPFDLAMLAGQIYHGSKLENPVLPHHPLVTKGWNLIEGFVAEPGGRYAALKPTLLPTLWTTFNAEGYKRASKE